MRSKAPIRRGTVLAGVTTAAALLFLLALLPIRVQQTNTSQPPPPPPPEPAKEEPPAVSAFAIHRDVDLVVLHVSVFNDRGEFVPGLKPEDFRIREDNVDQKISAFSQEDVPVSMGLVIDNSSSMYDKEAKVKAAALTFIQTSNPNDESFVANFADWYRLDHEFTGNIEELKKGLDRMDPRGTTALYDAVVNALDYVKKGYRDKKVLLVITDGVDNSSHHSLQQVVEQAQRSDAIVYSIGLFSDADLQQNPTQLATAKKALTDLANATGGSETFPASVNETETICTKIARDIRNQYTIGYYPTNEARDGTFRTIQVNITTPITGRLSVRTRSGRFATRAAAIGN